MRTTVKTRTKTPLVAGIVIALVAAGVGIVTQILSGTDFPTVPPGLLILLGSAAFVWFAPWRWSPIVGALAGLSQVVGLFAAGQAPRLFDFDPVTDSLGLWLQLLGVTSALVLGTAAVVQNYRGRTPGA
ncbi:MAG: hypothetical protein ACRDT4_03215 [Micromonosporaceae bacterium]